MWSLKTVFHFCKRSFSARVPVCAAMSFFKSAIVSSGLHLTRIFLPGRASACKGEYREQDIPSNRKNRKRQTACACQRSRSKHAGEEKCTTGPDVVAQKNSTMRGKNVHESDHSHAERRLPQHNGDGVQAKNADVPSRSSQTISIMLTEWSSCSQVVPFGNNNTEDKHGVLSNRRPKDLCAKPSGSHAQTCKRAS